MMKLLLLAGAAAMAAAAPAAANPGHGKPHVTKVTKVHTTAKGHKVVTTKVKTTKVKAKTWLTACPPGLVWRGPTCVPPGHAARLLAVGTRVPVGWSYTPWAAVPLSLRTGLDPGFRYIRRGDFIYAINPNTRRIVSVIAVP